MRLAFLFVALAAIVQGIQAQQSATVLIEDSTQYGSYNGFMSTSFVGLRLPSGGGTVSITFTPGDWASNVFVTSYADHTQAGPYYIGGPSTTITIGSTGKYWVYLAQWGSTSNYDYLEIRVEASNYGSTPTCYYCNPPSGWTSGWPPAGSPLVVGDNDRLPLPASQPGPPAPTYTRIPNWVIAVLAVVIGLAVFVPASYLVYRRIKNNKTPVNETTNIETTQTTTTTNETQVEMQPTVAIATAV